jgi:putative sterol carrier protein
MPENFADSIKKIYEPLNESEKFKEIYKEEQFKILLNPKDGEYAALLSIDKGKISVESIRNKPKQNLDKGALGWDGFLETKIEIFKDIGDGKLKGGDIIKKVVIGKIKVKGPKFLTQFSELGSILKED